MADTPPTTDAGAAALAAPPPLLRPKRSTSPALLFTMRSEALPKSAVTQRDRCAARPSMRA